MYIKHNKIAIVMACFNCYGIHNLLVTERRSCQKVILESQMKILSACVEKDVVFSMFGHKVVGRL